MLASIGAREQGALTTHSRDFRRKLNEEIEHEAPSTHHPFGSYRPPAAAALPRAFLGMLRGAGTR